MVLYTLLINCHQIDIKIFNNNHNIKKKYMNEVLKLSEDGKKLLWADKSITNVTIPKGVKIIGED